MHRRHGKYDALNLANWKDMYQAQQTQLCRKGYRVLDLFRTADNEWQS